MNILPLQCPVWETTVDIKERQVSHTIWICTVNNKEIIDHLFAAIVGLGAEVKAADSNKSLYHKKAGAQTTIAALTVSNFKDLNNSELLDKICSVISKYDYYGIVLEDNKNGISSWRAGNITSGKNLQNTLHKADVVENSEQEEPEPKPTEPEPKPTEPEPNPKKRLEGKSALVLLSRIVQATTSMSDVFFYDIPQQDRKFLARELEKLCERNDISIDDLPKS